MNIIQNWFVKICFDKINIIIKNLAKKMVCFNNKLTHGAW